MGRVLWLWLLLVFLYICGYNICKCVLTSLDSLFCVAFSMRASKSPAENVLTGLLLDSVGCVWYFSAACCLHIIFPYILFIVLPLLYCFQHLKKQNGHLPRHDMYICLLYTSPSPRDATLSRMPSSA